MTRRSTSLVPEPSPNGARAAEPCRRAWLFSVTVLAGLAAGIGAAELLVRVVPIAEPARVERNMDRGVFCQYDPILGYDGAPGLTAPWISGEAISINSRGNRDVDRPTAKTEDKLRVVLLGDSFLWGYGVRDQERTSNLLPQFFHDPFDAGRQIQPVNLAVSGYGTDQETLKYFLKGRDYRPDVVVLGFYSGNDPLENEAAEYWNCPKPRFVVRHGRLVLTGVPVRRLEGWSNNRLRSPTNSPVACFLGARSCGFSRNVSFLSPCCRRMPVAACARSPAWDCLMPWTRASTRVRSIA